MKNNNNNNTVKTGETLVIKKDGKTEIESITAKIEAMKAEQARLLKIESEKPEISVAELTELGEQLKSKKGLSIEALLTTICTCVEKLNGSKLVNANNVVRKGNHMQILSIFGHKANSMSAIIDEMLAKGATFEEISAEIKCNEKFANKTARILYNKISTHISYLGKRFYLGKSIKVVNENEIYKASFIG